MPGASASTQTPRVPVPTGAGTCAAIAPYISIQSSQMQAAFFGGGISSLATSIDNATGVARRDNAATLMLDMFGSLARVGIEGSRWRNLEIDEVRNLASVPLSVDAERPAQRINLFDLAPTRAPFKNLMDACWS